MKFGQLIECNQRNDFLQKNAENEAGRLVPDLFLIFNKMWKMRRKTIPRPFSKKRKLSISLDHYSLFLLCTKLKAFEIYGNYAADHLLLPHIKL